MPFRLALLLSLLALLGGGCAGDDDEAATTTVTAPTTETETATASLPQEAPVLLTLYFFRDGKLAPERRGITSRPAIATAALHQLFEGSTLDLATAIPPELRLRGLEIGNGVASLELGPRVPDRAALAQIVYTLTQFSTVKRVAVNGTAPVGRRAFEAQTPAILIENPLPYETVQSGFEVTGTANTFEATFNYELKDAAGKVIAKDFVTATSGSGTRGTFRFTVGYSIPKPQDGTLSAFEVSAADGSRTHTVELPLRLE
jgi:Immunoglobulin-like domain of bacterial spore germination/Sporulation and spore germination